MIDSFIVASTPVALKPFVTGQQNKARVSIYDITGRCISTTFEDLPYGTATMSLNRFVGNGRLYPSGIYIIRRVTSSGVIVQRITKQR